MAKRRRAKSSPPAPGKGGALRAVVVVLVVSLVAAAGFLVRSQRPPAPVPEPDLSAMEAQVAETIEEARGAVTESPRSAEAWGRLGMVFQAHELFSEAAGSYAVAFELAPEDARWPYLKAQCHKDLREIDAAREAVASAVRLNPSYAPHFVLAAELEELDNDPGAAVAFYRKAIEADASCAPAHFGVGRLVLTDDADEAREHLERAAALAPSAGAVQATLARLYRRQGDREAALRSAALARTLHPEVPLDDPVMAAVGNEAESVVGLQTRAVEAEARGDVAGAEALLRRMIALRPDEPNLYYNLGNNLSRQGRLDEAERSTVKRSSFVPSTSRPRSTSATCTAKGASSLGRSACTARCSSSSPVIPARSGASPRSPSREKICRSRSPSSRRRSTRTRAPRTRTTSSRRCSGPAAGSRPPWPRSSAR